MLLTLKGWFDDLSSIYPQVNVYKFERLSDSSTRILGSFDRYLPDSSFGLGFAGFALKGSIFAL